MDEIKYDKSTEGWQKCLDDEFRNKVSLTWLSAKSNLDGWRHNRIYELLKPIIEIDRNKKWVTVGDGRYGTDAHALLKMGAKDVLSTDISDILLKKGFEAGFINKYSAENDSFHYKNILNV